MLLVNRLLKLALAVLVAGVVAACGSLVLSFTGPIEQAYAANSGNQGAAKASPKNSKAHAAYKKKLKSLCNKYEQSSVYYQFVDLNRDGVDEMIVSWFPEIYTYSNGKVKRVDKARAGSNSYSIAPKAKVFCRIEFDHCGSATYRYFKWNGKKFAHVATLYTHDKNDTYLNVKSHYWVKGKGSVSKKVATKYVKKILKGEKERFISSNRQYNI